MTTKGDVQKLRYTTPGQNQGQIVEVSYAMDGEIGLVERTEDRSMPADDPERVTYRVIAWDDLPDFDPTWHPVNSVPSVDEDLWEAVG